MSLEELFVDLEGLAHTVAKMASPIDSAGEAHSKLASINANHGAFSGIDTAQAFAGQHTDVLDVYKSTLKALQSGLEDCRGNLKACADTHHENDQRQAEIMHSLANRLNGATSETRHAYQSGIRHEGQQAHQGGDGAHAQGAPGATGGKGLGE